MLRGSPSLFDVVEHTVRDLQHGLVDYVLVGPMGVSNCLLSRYANNVGNRGGLLDAELQAGEPLGQPVNDLLLDRDGQSFCRGRHDLSLVAQRLQGPGQRSAN